MTVADNTSRDQYTATSGQTVFPYTFEIFNKDDVVVVQNSTTLSEGTDYTVSGVGNNNGGNITFTSGATAGDTITIYRDMAYERTTDYQTSGDFLAAEVNADFDKLWLAVQQNEEADTRAIRKPISDLTSINMELPSATNRANRYLGFGPYGEVVTVADTGLAGEIADVKAYGADSTGTNDSTAAFQAAVDSGLSAMYIPSGTYKISSTININRDIIIFGDGNSSIIDTSSVPFLGTAFVFQAPEPELIEANSSAIIAGQRGYTFDSAHGLSNNDLVAIWDSNDFSYSSERYYYNKGEYLVVVDTDGLKANFFSGAFDAYGAGTSSFYKINTISVTLKDFTMVGSTDPSSGAFRAVRMRLCRNSVIDNVNFINAGNYSGLEIFNCYDVNVSNSSFVISEYATGYVNMYPLIIINSQRIRVTSCSSRSRWHAISTGGSVLAPAVVCREILISDCNLSSEDGRFAGDFHGNTEHSSYTNCVATGSGFTLGGDYNSFVNNKIMDIQRTLSGGGETDYAQSICFYSSENVGYNFIISNNTFEAAGSYTAASFGKFIHMVKGDTTSHTGTMVISNNNVLLLSEVSPYRDYVINIQDISTVSPSNVNILIDGNSFYNKSNPVEIFQDIRITTNGTDANDKFKSVIIKNNIMEKVGIDLDNIGDVVIDGNKITGSYQGVNLQEVNNIVFENNTVSDSFKWGLFAANCRGDYVVVNDNIFINNFSNPALVGSGTASSDVYLSTTTDMPYVKCSNNYIKCNGNAEQALTYNLVYGLQEFNNRIDGSGSVRKVWHAVQDADGASIFVGGETETTREFWHYGTTQTDFAELNFDNTSFGSALVRLHIANSFAGYTGVVEFGLEGYAGAGVSTVNYSYTSTNDPVAGGRLIITTVGQKVTLSIDDSDPALGSHVKAEIIKGGRVTLLRSLDVEWLV